MRRRALLGGLAALGCGQDMQIGLGLGMGFGGGSGVILPASPTNIAQSANVEGLGAAGTPVSILGDAAWWVRGDLNVTQAAGTASAWGDSSGHGVNFTAGASQPTYNATGLDSRPTLAGNNSNKILTASFSRAAPASQPFFIWLIARLNTWTINKYLWGDGGAALFMHPTTASVRPFNGTNGTNINLGSTSTWFRIWNQFDAAGNSTFRVGSAAAQNAGATGTSASGATTSLLSNPGNTLAGAGEIAEAFCFLGTPTAAQLAALDVYTASLFPSVNL